MDKHLAHLVRTGSNLLENVMRIIPAQTTMEKPQIWWNRVDMRPRWLRFVSAEKEESNERKCGRSYLIAWLSPGLRKRSASTTCRASSERHGYLRLRLRLDGQEPRCHLRAVVRRSWTNRLQGSPTRQFPGSLVPHQRTQVAVFTYRGCHRSANNCAERRGHASMRTNRSVGSFLRGWRRSARKQGENGYVRGRCSHLAVQRLSGSRR